MYSEHIGPQFYGFLVCNLKKIQMISSALLNAFEIGFFWKFFFYWLYNCSCVGPEVLSSGQK